MTTKPLSEDDISSCQLRGAADAAERPSEMQPMDWQALPRVLRSAADALDALTAERDDLLAREDAVARCAYDAGNAAGHDAAEAEASALRHRLEEAERERDALRGAAYAAMGKLNCTIYRAGFIAKWHADPNCDVPGTANAAKGHAQAAKDVLVEATTANSAGAALTPPSQPPAPDPLLREMAEAAEGVVNWCDFAFSHKSEFNHHGVSNLDGPAFDKLRAALTKASAAGLLAETADAKEGA